MPSVQLVTARPNRWAAFSAAEIIMLELAAGTRLEGWPRAVPPAPSALLEALRAELLADLASRGLEPLPAPEGGTAWEDAC